MSIAKIAANDLYTSLYFNNMMLRYTDNEIINFIFCRNPIDNYPEVYVPEVFYEKLLSREISLQILFNEYKNILTDMSKKYRSSI